MVIRIGNVKMGRAAAAIDGNSSIDDDRISYILDKLEFAALNQVDRPGIETVLAQHASCAARAVAANNRQHQSPSIARARDIEFVGGLREKRGRGIRKPVRRRYG